jgi:pimeloyl-ACP methyl ester carboxylesterase
MRTRHLTTAAALFGLAAAPVTADAGGLNDEACRPSPRHPNPVVLVHGRGGDVEGFGPMVATLNAAGHCVYGVNYGRTDGTGPNGHDHLTVSGGQIAAFIDQVLDTTGADQVDVIGHSAGTGVIDNIILMRDEGDAIRRVVSFGGLHHPYAHAGASGFADATLFLPNLIATARLVDPDVTAQQVIVAAINLYAGAGGSLAGIDVETATSNFAADLFEPDYWTALHGGLSETSGHYITFGNSRRGLVTQDASPSICYTNIVGIGDLLAGAAAGFQDDAPNVDNFLLLTPADHVQILTDGVAVAKLLTALDTPCVVPPPPGQPGGPDDPDPEDPDAPGGVTGGCNSSDAAAGGAALTSCLLAGLALALLVRRHRGRIRLR